MRPGSVLLVVAAGIAAAATTPRAQSHEPMMLDTESSSNVFFARATVNGAGPYWLTIDTGATLTVLDPLAVKRANLPIRGAGRRPNVGVGESEMEMSMTIGARIAVEGLPVFAPPVLYVVSVGSNAPLLGHTIDGVLGTDFLRQHIVEFDYESRQVLLRPSSAPGSSPLQRGVSFVLDGNLLVAPAMLTLPDGQRLAARLLIDTGSNGALTLTTPFVRQHNLVARFPARRASLAVGINGTVSSPVITLQSVAFGDATTAAPNAALSQATAGLDASSDFDGIIGAELLRQFNLTVDYPNRRVMFSPPKRQKDR